MLAACCKVRHGFANVPGFASLPLVATNEPAGGVTAGRRLRETALTRVVAGTGRDAGTMATWATELSRAIWVGIPATPTAAFAIGPEMAAVARAGPARSAGPASRATASADRIPTDRLLWIDALWAPLGTNDTGRSSLPEPTSMRPRERWRTAARNRPGVTMRGRWDGIMPVKCVVSRQRFRRSAGQTRRTGLGTRSSGEICGMRQLAGAPPRGARGAG